MASKKSHEVNKTDGSEPPLENPPKDWTDEDVEIEGRKPDLGEIEEDESEM